MTKPIRIGTRASALALRQAGKVLGEIAKNSPELSPELVRIRTTGDRFLDKPTAEIGGKGVFVKEIEEALLDDRIDIAVHSVKDLPGVLPEGLELIVFPRREDSRDVFLSKKYPDLESAPAGAKIGTGSVRRRAQLLALRPDLEVVPLRGNVTTRVKKLARGELDAVILAAAGLNRLGLSGEIRSYLDPENWLPAAGQGAVGIEARGESEWRARLGYLNDPGTEIAVRAERVFLSELEGSCQVPLAAHTTLAGGRFKIRGLIASLDGRDIVRGEAEGSSADATQVARTLALRLLGEGGDRILATILGRRPAGG